MRKTKVSFFCDRCGAAIKKVGRGKEVLSVSFVTSDYSTTTYGDLCPDCSARIAEAVRKPSEGRA